LERGLQLKCGLLRIGKLRSRLIDNIPIGSVFDPEENVARFEMLAGLGGHFDHPSAHRRNNRRRKIKKSSLLGKGM
jgi:hypothetical protein